MIEKELQLAFNSIIVEKLTEDEKKELLRLFEASKIRYVYTEIAFILTAVNYVEAVPVILKKINDKEFYNRNGSLIYALQAMDVVNYLDAFVKIICEQGYLARMEALSIIEKIAPNASDSQKRKSLKILNYNFKKMLTLENSAELESTLKFMFETKKIIKGTL